MTLSKLLKLSEHQLSGDNNNCIDYTGLLRRLSEMMLVEGPGSHTVGPHYNENQPSPSVSPHPAISQFLSSLPLGTGRLITYRVLRRAWGLMGHRDRQLLAQQSCGHRARTPCKANDSELIL